MVAYTYRFAGAIACLVAGSAVDAFAPSITGKAAVNSFRANKPAVGPLFADGDGPKDGTTIKSARKERG
jgi:hypothetical protein